MATLTIRNLPEQVVRRLKTIACRKGRSMEQEVRELLLAKYTARSTVANRIRARWEGLPNSGAEELDEWAETGRR